MEFDAFCHRNKMWYERENVNSPLTVWICRKLWSSPPLSHSHFHWRIQRLSPLSLSAQWQNTSQSHLSLIFFFKSNCYYEQHYVTFWIMGLTRVSFLVLLTTELCSSSLPPSAKERRLYWQLTTIKVYRADTSAASCCIIKTMRSQWGQLIMDFWGWCRCPY